MSLCLRTKRKPEILPKYTDSQILSRILERIHAGGDRQVGEASWRRGIIQRPFRAKSNGRYRRRTPTLDCSVGNMGPYLRIRVLSSVPLGGIVRRAAFGD